MLDQQARVDWSARDDADDTISAEDVSILGILLLSARRMGCQLLACLCREAGDLAGVDVTPL